MIRHLLRCLAVPAVLAVAACAATPPSNPVEAGPARRFAVVFPEWSGTLDTPGLAAVAAAAAAARAQPGTAVTVVAGQDELAALRGRMVADQLVAEGVARGRIRQLPGGAGAVDVLLGGP